MGENIGAAARAMWNFGLEYMRLVDPRDGWPNTRAVAMASGAGRVLDQAQIADLTTEAIADRQFVFATTARARDLAKPVFSPEEAMARARAMIASGVKVAFLFGPERAGLENADVVRANALVSVPVNPAFGSLNLAQCVLLLAYEWRRAAGANMASAAQDEERLATGLEAEKLFEHLVARLDSAGFFWPDHKAASMQTNLRNLISRLPLSEADTRMLHGIIRALAEKSPH
ncbi:MAG: RNA methyltransferase [Paracoccaceae bacterium]